MNATAVDAQRLDAEALSQIRAMLVSARVLQQAAADEHAATAIGLVGQGDVDSLLERELADAQADRAREALADIDAALARLDDGTYGSCESCGLPIALPRLEAIPQARLCVACSSGRGGILVGSRPRATAASNG